MSNVTRKIGQIVLDSVVRFKDLITGAGLAVGTKYIFEESATESLMKRRKSEKSPVRFVFRDTSSRALVQISSFDFHSFLFGTVAFDKYFVLYPADEVDTLVAESFTVKGFNHQLVDNSFVSELPVEDNLDVPKLKYPLYLYNGYSNYKAQRSLLLEKETNKDDFRMPAEHIEICRKSGIPSSSVGNHFKQLDLDCHILQVDDAQVKKYQEKLKA
jgi:hypothetical protein